MKRISAGLIAYRQVNNTVEFLIAHPGGPFYKNKDLGFWSIVKGEVNISEDLLNAAKREFTEETGFEAIGPFIELGFIKQKAGKTVYCWAFHMDYDLSKGFNCNMIILEWPTKKGKLITIPEIDKLEYFSFEEALQKINEAQKELLKRLMVIIKPNY